DAAADARESPVRSLAERTVWRLSMQVRQAVRERHTGIELAGRLGDEHVPLVGALGRRLSPGAGFQHPLSRGRAALEEHAGEVVKAGDARTGRVRTHLRVHMR